MGHSFISVDPKSFSSDTFGRLRVSNPYSLFDAKTLTDNLPLIFDDQEVSGSGTASNFTAVEAQVVLSVSASTAGKRVRQSFTRFNYHSGKSQLIVCTGSLENGVETGISGGIGYFDDDNGLFLKFDADGLYFVTRSKVSGSVVDTEIPQSEWNRDKLDGVSRSGYTLDISKNQIFFIDFQWLGAGIVRFGFDIDGYRIICHEERHANVLNRAYMSNPNLPVRYEIENDGTGGAASLRVGCQSVITEAEGNTEKGVVFYDSNANTPVDATTAGTYYALLGLRLKSGHESGVITTNLISVISSALDTYEWVLLYNPTIAGSPSWASVNSASHVETFKGSTSTTVTGGYRLAGSYVNQDSKGGATVEELITELRLGSYIDGTKTTLVLAAQPLGSGTINANLLGGIQWRELS